MVLETEIVVDSRYVEVARNGHVQVSRKSQNVSVVTQVLWLQVALDCGSYLFHICETKGLRPGQADRIYRQGLRHSRNSQRK